MIFLEFISPAISNCNFFSPFLFSFFLVLINSFNLSFLFFECIFIVVNAFFLAFDFWFFDFLIFWFLILFYFEKRSWAAKVGDKTCVVVASGRNGQSKGRRESETCLLQLKISGFVKKRYSTFIARSTRAQCELAMNGWIPSIFLCVNCDAAYRRAFHHSLDPTTKEDGSSSNQL